MERDNERDQDRIYDLNDRIHSAYGRFIEAPFLQQRIDRRNEWAKVMRDKLEKRKRK